MALTKIRKNQLDIEAILDAVYPVGTEYVNHSDSTNPATLFGIGTWVLTSIGKVIVGLDTGDTDFDTIGETGGEKAHTLLSTEMPSHTHTQDSHNHAQDSHYHSTPTHVHSIPYKGFTGLSSNSGGWNISRRNDAADSYVGESWAALQAGWTVAAQTATNQAATATNQNTGGGGSHNNLQPYVVVYIWKRTA